MQAQGEESFACADGLSWRTGTVGSKKRDAFSNHIPRRFAHSMHRPHEVTQELQTNITQMPGGGDFHQGWTETCSIIYDERVWDWRSKARVLLLAPPHTKLVRILLASVPHLQTQ